MKKRLFKVLKYILFLSVGILIFWWVYKDIEIEELKQVLREINYFWIGVSIFLNLLSQISRAIRWNMLIRPMGYHPRLINSFFAVLTMYFVNLIIPRAGEIGRCTVLTRYERIPFSKLVGTVFVERLADVIMLFILAVFIIGSQFDLFNVFLDTHPEFGENMTTIFTLNNMLIALGVIILLFAVFLLISKYYRENVLYKKLVLIKQNLVEGVKSIFRLQNARYFIAQTMFIFLMWLIMLYVVFLAFEPTSHLSIGAGMLTFLMGGLAMLAPVQGGIGPWHFMVYETLLLYGIEKSDGKIFALIAHTSTNLIYLVLGLAAFLILPLVNNNHKK